MNDTAEMEAMKGKKSSVASALVGAGAGSVNSIVFACDAGMGSSAMGASVLRRKIQQAGFADVKVTNSAISNLTDSYDVVVSHRDLTARARQKTPSAAHVSVEDFMSSPRYDEIVEQLKQTNGGGGIAVAEELPEESAGATGDSDVDVLPLSSIVMSGTARSAADAITEAGRLLVAAGAVEQAYVDAMHERESSISTYMGNGLAIPHGTNEAKDTIRRTGLSFVRYAEPIDWNGKPAEFVVGIAGAGKDHMAMLTKIAQVFLKADDVARLREAQTAEEVRSILMAAEK
jgi:mannitol PTS system EIICBA or EIICB component